ncbi:MAG: hypothetical protein V8Q40_06135 [Anaerosacchariphilus sp.]
MRTGQNIYKRKDGRWEARFRWASGPMAAAISNHYMPETAFGRKNAYEKNIPSRKRNSSRPADSLTYITVAAYGWLAASEQDLKPGHLCPIQELSGEVYFAPMEAAPCA